MNLFKNLGPQRTEALYSRVSSVYRGPIKTREELERFLQRKAEEGRVTFERGEWVLVEEE
jgi:Anaphase promoting complex (APC) subunit 2